MDADKVERDVSIRAVVCPPRTLFLRLDMGTATNDKLGEFELSTNAGTGDPIVRLPDGRWVTFPWNSLINAAVEAGKKTK